MNDDAGQTPAPPAPPAPARSGSGFGKLIWVVGPLAVLAVLWQLRPHSAPQRSSDMERLQENPGGVLGNLDRYAEPPPKKTAEEPEEKPASQPPATKPAEPQ
jgi:hypothetical protein